MNETARPLRVDGAHVDRVGVGVAIPRTGALAVDGIGLGVEPLRRQESLHVVAEGGIGDFRIAHGEGTLGRFDQAVDVVEAFAALHPQPVEQAEDDQRGQPLGRRRRVEERAVGERQRQWRRQPRFVLAQILAGHRRADLLEVGGDLGGNVAAIEVAIAGAGDLVERIGKARLHHR